MLFLLVQIKLLVLISLKSDMYAVFQAFSLLLNLENMGLMAILGCVLIFITFAFCYERFPSSAEQAEALSNMSIKEQISSLIHNKYWLMLSTIILFTYMGDTIYNTANIYFCQYVLHDREVVGNDGCQRFL